MPICKLTTEEVVQGILHFDERVMNALATDEAIWRSFQSHGGTTKARFFSRKLLYFKKLSIEDEKSAFSDTLLCFRDKVFSGQFKDGDYRAYIYALGQSKYQNYSRRKEDMVFQPLDPNLGGDFELDIEPIRESDLSEKMFARLERMFHDLGRTGAACYQIWKAFIDQHDYQQIATLLTARDAQQPVSEVAARQQATDCKRRFREVHDIELPSKTDLRP